MIYTITHVTEYAYDIPATSAKLALHVVPINGYGQNCLAHQLVIAPQPRQINTYRDFFGNVVTLAIIETPLVNLRIEAQTRLEVIRPPGPPPNSTDDWAKVAESALAVTSIGPEAPIHFIFQSHHVTLDEDVTDYARESFPSGRPIADGARDFAARIKRDFAYMPDTTDISTPLKQAFQQRSGVCQDFAHIMIAGLRGLGIPAAYVSGYLRTIPPPGLPRLVGADASHAWVSVWCGADDGWFGIDPTNASDACSDHILLARGRDFSDVSPILGVFHGSGNHGMKVSVDVAPES